MNSNQSYKQHWQNNEKYMKCRIYTGTLCCFYKIDSNTTTINLLNIYPFLGASFRWHFGYFSPPDYYKNDLGNIKTLLNVIWSTVMAAGYPWRSRVRNASSGLIHPTMQQPWWTHEGIFIWDGRLFSIILLSL